MIIVIVLVVISFLLDKTFLFFMSSIKNYICDIVMGWISQSISMFIILIIITSIFLWEERKSRCIKPLWMSFFTTLVIVLIIKLIIMRPRPFGNELLIPFSSLVDYSFPSMHAAAAFSVLPVLELEFPRIKWFWIIFALLIALSRVYLGVHYLSDVVAGAFMGYLIGKFYVLKAGENKR